MATGGKPNPHLDETNLADAKNAKLTDAEIDDLVAFLNALDVNYTIDEPTLP
jgi:hypothetical protein